jgi:hypothetical protein
MGWLAPLIASQAVVDHDGLLFFLLSRAARTP